MNDQRSVTEQLRELVALANKTGLYDAADWIVERMQRDRELLERLKSSTGSKS